MCALLVESAQCGCNANAPQREVVAYIAVDRKDAEPILMQFEQETGIHVRALYDAEAAKTTGLVTRLIAETKRPRCDVFWNNEIVQTLLLADRGLLESYRSPNAEGLPNCLRDASDRWTAVATRTRVIVYNTELIAPADVPLTLEELCDAKWKGKVAIANPMFGTTRTHIAALYAEWGPDESQNWLRGLLDNDVRIVDGNAMVKNLVARADPDASPILVGLTDTDDVRSGQSEGEPIDFVYPDQSTSGTFVIPTTVCMVKGAPNHGAAKSLIDFLVSLEAETTLTADKTGYAPVRPMSRPTFRSFDVANSMLLEHLASSTEWTSRHFHD
jgi:iron(III) transport system substrate-binding protein